MRVKYIKNREVEIPDVPFSPVNSREYLDIGHEYNVYGIFLNRGNLSYLIVGNDKYRIMPTWEPVELFELIENKLPPNWYFQRSQEIVPKEKLNDPDSAIWGYKELACDISHNDDLILEMETEAIKIFLKRKLEIDEWEKSNK